MVPMVAEYEADDEFVRTISDDDVDSAFPEEEDSIENELILTSASQDRKRKHDSSQDFTHAARRKRRKEEKAPDDLARHGNNVRQKGMMSMNLEQNETWSTQEEDNGTMDSDFEFQITGVGTGIVEDFDIWDLERSEINTVQKGRDKKGVDIESIIARRKDLKIPGTQSNGNRAEVHDQSPSKVPLFDEEEEQDAARGSDEGADASTEKKPLGGKYVGEEDEALAEDAFGMGAEVDGYTRYMGSENSDHTTAESDSQDEVAVAEAMPDSNDFEISSGEEEEPEETAKRNSFFAPEESFSTANAKETSSSRAFQSMNLSRPILRGLTSVGFINPTPIQKKTIPVALLAKDIVGGAVTGSGKTAAFMIPILERLLYRPKKISTTRVAILMPTRELAVQCFTVAKNLASFTDITFALLTGGFSLREQESGLRNRPDIIIATPGRFIDHMRNSPSFTVDTLEILVLDEADRMLEDGFADELNEILNTIPKSRQTMLFSATMTDKVDKLIRVGLNRPVRLMVDARKQTVVTLTQEFIRLRPGREEKRLGYLTHLCSNVFTERIIVFFRQKKEAHRVRIIFGLLGIKAAELHGSMSQEQRISSLKSFRDGHSTHLLATDLASRGLDIPSVSVVLNFEAPQSHEIYLHRVGRTARAGRGGRACTIAAESDRRVVKQAVKAAKAQGAKIASRVIDPLVADEWAANVKALDEEVEAILKDEKEEKLLNQTDMVIRKGENMICHEDEIQARPKRTWFESERDKLQAKKAGKEELNGGVGLEKFKHGGKLSNKIKKLLDDKRERVESRAWKKGKRAPKAISKENGSGRVKGGVRSRSRGATEYRGKRAGR